MSAHDQTSLGEARRAAEEVGRVLPAMTFALSEELLGRARRAAQAAGLLLEQRPAGLTLCGGGMELALACDFRIGVPKTSFSAPEYGFGWVPGWGGVHRLGALVGQAKAKEILLLEKKIRGEEALRLGLLTELVEDPEQLIDRAFEMGAQLAKLNPLTVTYTKTILNDFEVPTYDALIQGLTNGITSKSPYCREQIEKFFNRKK